MSGTADDSPVRTPADRARVRVLDAHAAVLDGVLRVADAVAEDWPALADGRRATSDRESVVPPLRAGLERTGLLDALPSVLADAVDAAGYDLAAPPVPAPPYVAVTSTGPVLRATVDDGRLVLSLDCFSVVRADEMDSPEAEGVTEGEADVVYARTNDSPEAALSVTFHPRSR